MEQGSHEPDNKDCDPCHLQDNWTLLVSTGHKSSDLEFPLESPILDHIVWTRTCNKPNKKNDDKTYKNGFMCWNVVKGIWNCYNDFRKWGLRDKAMESREYVEKGENSQLILMSSCVLLADRSRNKQLQFGFRWMRPSKIYNRLLYVRKELPIASLVAQDLEALRQ